ncbi:MAG: ATPase [Eubacteriales bacterium]|nr:ATPase [Eubacteriales bacterium]
MIKERVRHMFPGGNTSKGFFSFYEYILNQEDANRIYVIKGGPGTGKSTFMKSIANEMLGRGYDVEFMHCSSDPDSLDGVTIPALKIAMLDGTSPHVVDPVNPGAVDEIIHLGDYWDKAGIREHHDEILIIKSELGSLFTRAYRYLSAAASVYSDNVEIFRKATDIQNVNKKAMDIINTYFAGEAAAEYEGGSRKLFAGAITPKGLKNFLSGILNTEKIILLKGEPGTGTELLLEKVREHALICGYYVESYYCALNPDRLEHIVIPEKNLSIATTNKYHTVLSLDKEVIDMNEFYDNDIVDERMEIIEYNSLEFEGLLNRAVMTLEQAKRMHDELERNYVPFMDFAAVDGLRGKILDEILEYTD